MADLRSYDPTPRGKRDIGDTNDYMLSTLRGAKAMAELCNP